jgi:hypothetical protein
MEIDYIYPCPFCGSESIDAEGWLDGDGNRGPECLECGATADSLGKWNRRDDTELTRLRTVLRGLVEAANAMLDMYVALANSGDCGNWNPHNDKEVINLKAAIAAAEEEGE